jgi:hypothetical protein
MCLPVVNNEINFRVVQNAGNFLTNDKSISFPRKTLLFLFIYLVIILLLY